LVNANLTEAERTDPVNLFPGDVLEFHQNATGFCKGERVVVGKEQLPLNLAPRFQAFKSGQLHLAVGDLVRITKNGMTADGKHRLNNGARYAVKAFDQSGDIILDNGWTVAKDYGHLAHGYVSTSHSSQGKTVDHVLIGQSAESFPASSREQFYVSVSRGRQQATIYTGDKLALLEAVNRSDDRLTATEFVDRRERVAVHQRQAGMVPVSKEPVTINREARDHER
jgi:ATP-dependent exoDNAse (exonuclease V) alpha subunit